MEQPQQYVEHDGIIHKIGEDVITVNLTNSTVCSSCHAKSACGVSEDEDKFVEVLKSEVNYEIGEQVSILFDKSLGAKGIFLGYLLPFTLVLVTLIISVQITANDAIAGFISLGVLVPYYISLSLFKQRIKQTFTFKIRKQ